MPTRSSGPWTIRPGSVLREPLPCRIQGINCCRVPGRSDRQNYTTALDTRGFTYGRVSPSVPGCTEQEERKNPIQATPGLSHGNHAMLHPFETTPRRTGRSPQRHAAPSLLNSGHGESRLSSRDNLRDRFAQAGPFPAGRLPGNQGIPSILSIVSGRKNTTGSAKKEPDPNGIR